MKRGKRTNLTSDDVDNALRLRYYKITPKKNTNSFRLYLETYPTHRESKESDVDEDAMIDIEGFDDEEEQNLQPIIDPDVLIDTALPKHEGSISMGVHWLAVDGTQTKIPENPLSIEGMNKNFLNGNRNHHKTSKYYFY